MLRYEEVAELVRIIDRNSCAEFDLDTVELKLVVRRHRVGGQVAPPAVEPPSTAPLRTGAGASPQAATLPAVSRKFCSDDSAAGRQFIEVLIMGSFYRTPLQGEPT